MKLVLLYCFIVSVLYVVSGRDVRRETHNTRTEMGVFTGRVDSVRFMSQHGDVISYLGVPYAVSPTGWKRLWKPMFPERLTRSYNATFLRPACLQLNTFEKKYPTSEDCLFLNIYAPIESTINPVKQFPVLIYIHGGNFMSGSARDVSPEVFVLVSDVIVVTMNYRLGVFGFFSSGYDTYGNYGLWDQHFAIKWVRYNIASFGGDVNKITVMGHEAGAASALYQAMYPGNRGLIHRVIALDGSSLSPWALQTSRAGGIGLHVECFKPKDSVLIIGNQSLAECVRNKPALDLLKASVEVGHMGPTIDGEFVVEHPHRTLFPQNRRMSDGLEFFYSLDVIIGTVKKHDHQKLFELLAALQNGFAERATTLDKNMFEHVVVPETMKSLYESWSIMQGYPILPNIRAKIDQSVIYKYTNWTDPNNQTVIVNNSLEMSSDINYLMPAVLTTDSHIETTGNGSTYMIQFAHASSLRSSKKHGAELVKFPDKMYLFGFSNKLVDEKEMDESGGVYILSRQTMSWINNFVRNGDPNSPNKTFGYRLPFRWERYDTNRSYLQFNSNSSMRPRFGEPSTTFWTSLVPVLLQDNTTFTIVSPVPYGFAESIYIATFRVSAKLAEYLIIALTVGASLLLVLLFVVTCIVCQMKRSQVQCTSEVTEKPEHVIEGAF